ncbi:MAG: TMEM165/GDT1 family protein [Acidimicrobiales bacterium]
MSIKSLVQAFVTIFPAELPDKTMIATIVLVTRYRRPGWVWLGAVSAFTVHVLVAVAAGSAISLLPDTPVKLVVATLFAVGAVLLLRAARSRSDDHVDTDDAPTRTTVYRTVAGSFALILLAEWGDLTQLATASLAAKSGEPVSTGVGALLALAAVAAIAAAFGRQLVARVPLHKINYVGAAVFAALALWTLGELVF